MGSVAAIHGDELRPVTLLSAAGLSPREAQLGAASGGLDVERLGYFPEFVILRVAEERGYRVSAVVLGEIAMVVHYVIHGHGWRG